MFTLTKILSLFVYPLSLGLFFVGLSLWGQLRGNRAAAGLYTFLALGVIYVPSTQFGVDTFATPLEARYPAFAPEESPMVTSLLYWVVVWSLREVWALGRS